MRLDLFLKKSRIVKRRTVAKELVEKGVVTVDGERTKPSKDIKPGMIIGVDNLSYEVIEIPDREIKSNEGDKYYRILDDRDYSG